MTTRRDIIGMTTAAAPNIDACNRAIESCRAAVLQDLHDRLAVDAATICHHPFQSLGVQDVALLERQRVAMDELLFVLRARIHNYRRNQSIAT
jgi:copper oxidase (laccase) domain-containing protein